MACTYPGARRVEQFWENILNKVDAITEVSPERWNPAIFYDPDPNAEDRLYSKKGGWIPDSFSFNPFKFGIPPSSIAGSEPDHTLLIRCVFEALEDAGYLKREFNRERTSVTVGKGNYVGPGLMWMTLRTVVVEMMLPVVRAVRPDLSDEQIERLKQFLRSKLPTLAPDAANGLVPNIASARISNRFDFMGRNMTVDAACGSMLIATEIAVRNLLMGLDDMALIGSVHCYNNIPFLQVFKVMRAISLTSTIRPFDADADGTMAGEGVSMMVLKRLADAERDGDRIYAVIKGVGSSSDGKAKAVMAPRVEGEVLAIRRAYEMAELPSDSIELIECHGTGTVVGDGVEIDALRRTYGPNGDGHPTVAIGSVKSMIGHAMPAAGGASLIKTALALYHRVLPPTLNVNQPHPLLREGDCRFYINSETRPWIHRAGGEPRRAAVSAFGFGGINAHVIMEEYNGAPEARLPTFYHEWECEVVVVEGETRAGLAAALARLRAYAVQVEGVALRDVAYTLNTSLKGAAHRVAIVASSLEELAQKIDRVTERLADPECLQIRERAGLYYFDSPELHTGKVAVLFPGEGSQYLNMLSDLCVHFPEVRKSFDVADGAVKDPKYPPLSSVVFPPPAFSEEEEAAAEARLWTIERATESVLTADGGMYSLLHEIGLRPDIMAGHSAGEWIAMAASGMLDLSEFISGMDRLSAMYTDLAERTEVPRMAMLAVGTGSEKIREFAAQIGCEVHIANDNCPHQVVAVVDPKSVDALTEHLLKNGVFVEKLPYDRGYHTPSFTYICDPLRNFFQALEIRAPRLPVYSCMTQEHYPSDREEILELVSNTFARPLLFRQTVEKMYEEGARVFVESGPRGNLTAFVDDVLRGRPHLAIPTDLLRRPGLTVLNHAVGMMAAAHVSLDLTPLYRRRSPRKLALDVKADSVLPEEKQPGVIQVSTCYTKLAIPAREDFPMPVGQVSDVSLGETSDPYLEAASPLPSAPAGDLHGGEQFPGPMPAALRGPVPSSAFLDHFALMEEFLRTEEEIMTRMAGSGAGSVPSPVEQVSSLPAVALQPQVFQAPMAPVSVVVEPPPSPARAPAAAPADLAALLVRVVAERTGYPQEMLGLDQDMEADLGIDSIKRVEIFGALRELSGEAALGGDGDMEAVAKLKTLREVLAFLEEKMPAATHAAVPVTVRPASMAAPLGSLLRTATIVQQVPGESVTLALALDLDEHRYLRDHSLYYPSSERDNQTNRIYVMPLTGSLELMCQAAALVAPEMKVVGSASTQVFRPLNVTENEGPTNIQITAARHGSGEVRVAIREDKPSGSVFSQSNVLLASAYPPAPAAMDLSLVNSRAPMCKDRDVYSTHRMFHGPSFQGICAIDAVGENGLLAKLEILPTGNLLRSHSNPQFQIDPYLLDAAGQLVGYWPLEYLNQGFVVLPVKIAGLSKFCENPPPGAKVEYRLSLRNVSQRTLAADYDVLLPDGRLWLRVTGWEDWRFYWPPTIYNCWRFAKTESPSEGIAIPALENKGYECRLIHTTREQERDGLAGEVWMRILLNRKETAEFERVRADKRADWLLVRTTAKDAVRAWTTRQHGRQLFPADIEMEIRPDGGFEVGGFWSAEVPVPKVSAYFQGAVSVAVAGPAETAVVALEMGKQDAVGAFLPEEEDWLGRMPDPTQWKARALAAKQAAGRYLRPTEYGEYWKTLVISKIDAKQGMMEIADPGLAVNAEDTISVATALERDLIIAIAFK
jgi:acyl transferase domain-containing protein